MIAPLERARDVACLVAARHAEAVDAEGRFPSEAIAALKESRLMGAFVPRELGGEGATVSEVASICHLLGRACGSTGLIYAMHLIQTACIVLHGQTNAWQRDVLRQVTSEQLLLASATTEGATGGDLGRSADFLFVHPEHARHGDGQHHSDERSGRARRPSSRQRSAHNHAQP